MQDIITIWNGNFLTSLNSADQDITFKFFCDIYHPKPIHLKFREKLEFQKLHSSLRKSVNLNRGREAKQFRDLLGGGKFRVDDHGKTELLLDKADLFVIHGISNSRDCVTFTCLLCNQAAQQIQFV